MSTLVTLLLCVIPPPPVALEDTADKVEVNHLYNEEGQLVFDQLIWYDWSPKDRRDQVRAWRLVKVPEILPRRQWGSNLHLSHWMDGEILRKVYARSTTETWTQIGVDGDPELAEREYLPKEERKELSAPPTKRSK